MNKQEAEKQFPGVGFEGDSFDIKQGAIIQAGAVIGEHIILENNAVIQSGAIVHRCCYIGEGVTIKARSIIRDSSVLF